ncbi:hypothetical protein FIBSPDRAFT_836378 [Athelia psychrophila]|uniref:Uncharacterized protein n=1 Tax=Athelia psychrophila TaxID=1759441 RepID=A0A166B6K6_9AGAM|nr:hypothetical protein FIBSPDRAFT_836378 [Fibularhizoctonia sp. CBS 109695]
MLQYLLLLCAFAVPGIRALACPVIDSATAEDSKCLDITHCRTLWNIVWSCLITILACTWVSIHHNVVLDSKSGINIAALWERVWVTALTLLVPEFTVVWAVRQWIVWGVLRERYSGSSPWTTTHGFFVLMGGFYHFHGDEAHHPASREEVANMISEGSFAPPNILAIKGRGKRDVFSKTVTVLQMLWFVIQCIARGIQHLPITDLEIATLAYTTISVAMYRFWLNKPVNVSHPIQLKRIEGPVLQLRHFHWPSLEDVAKAAGGVQDEGVNLSELRQVPTLYAGKPEEHQISLANTIALAVGAVFGAVHCIAWSFVFPSQIEMSLWRISAGTTVAIPLGYVMSYVLIPKMPDGTQGGLKFMVIIVSMLAIPFYVMARAVLLVLTFTTLRDLPPAAYQTIHWMSFIPHI